MYTDAADEPGESTVEPRADEYELQLTGSGLSLRRSLPEPIALKVLSVVMGGAAGSFAGSGAHAESGETASTLSAAGGSTTPLAVSEYVAECGARRNVDKIVSIATYLQDYEGMHRWTPVDVKGKFPAAGEAVPSNFPRDFKWALSAKWIAPDPGAGKDMYYVTSTGRRAVDGKFAKEVVKSTRQKGAKSRKRSAAANGDDQ